MENAKDQQLPLHGTSSIVKEEKLEDKEIRIMAAKMKEHRQQQQIQQIQQQIQVQPTATPTTTPRVTTIVTAKRTDLRFGWAELKQIEPGLQENNLTVIPFLYRDTEKFCSARMLQQKLRDFHLHPIIAKCSFLVRKCEIFDTEVRMLNDINYLHCDGQFGGVITRNDKVLSLRDALDYYQYRVECHRLLTSFIPGSIPKKCGFLQLEGFSPMAFVVVKGVVHVPVFYFQDIPQELMAKTQVLRGWDLAYLKFGCTVQSINPNILAQDYLIVIPIVEIKNKIKENVSVTYFWPSIEDTSAIPAGSGTRDSSLASSQT